MMAFFALWGVGMAYTARENVQATSSLVDSAASTTITTTIYVAVAPDSGGPAAAAHDGAPPDGLGWVPGRRERPVAQAVTRSCVR